MVLTNESIKNREAWEALGYRLPKFDRDAMVAKTVANPTWLHFGAGNIFKAFQADACQRLLDAGLADTGIIRRQIRELRNAGCQFIIIQCHWGNTGDTRTWAPSMVLGMIRLLLSMRTRKVTG